MNLKTNELLEIQDYLETQNLTSLQLLQELQDHFTCKVGEIMSEEGLPFDEALTKAKERICPNGAEEIEKDIHFLLTINKHIMIHNLVFAEGTLGGFVVLISIALGIGGIIDIELSRLLIMCGLLMVVLVVYPYMMYRWYNKSRNLIKEEMA